MDTFRLNVETVRRTLPSRGPEAAHEDVADRLAERVIEVEPIVERDAREGRPARAAGELASRE